MTQLEAARKGTVTAEMHFVAKREDLDAMAAELFEVILNGDVKVPIHARFPLAEAGEAHRMLESRESIGSTILLP